MCPTRVDEDARVYYVDEPAPVGLNDVARLGAELNARRVDEEGIGAAYGRVSHPAELLRRPAAAGLIGDGDPIQVEKAAPRRLGDGKGAGDAATLAHVLGDPTEDGVVSGELTDGEAKPARQPR